MRALPTVTADVPSNLGKTRADASPYMTTANATKTSHTESRYNRETQLGRLVHLDVAGPLLESKIGRFKYLMLLIDDSSRFRIAIPMRSREEASAKIRGFISRFNALAAAFGGRIARVGSLLSDGAKELVSNELQEYLDNNGADKKQSPPRCMRSTGALNAASSQSSRSSALNSSSNPAPLAPFGPSQRLLRWTS